MLQKMGWADGKGLGATEEGVTAAPRVAKRAVSLGLGAEDDGTGNGKLAQAVGDYNSLLARLSAAHGTGSGAASDGAGGGAQDGAGDGAAEDAPDSRAARKAAKRRRKEERRRARKPKIDGLALGGAAPELAARHKRPFALKCKDVKSYSAGDLASILGHTEGSALAFAPMPSPSPSPSPSTASRSADASASASSGSEAEAGEDRAARKAARKAEKEARRAARKQKKAAKRARETPSEDK